MTEALQKVTREMKAMSADKYDVTAQGEMQDLIFSTKPQKMGEIQIRAGD